MVYVIFLVNKVDPICLCRPGFVGSLCQFPFNASNPDNNNNDNNNNNNTTNQISSNINQSSNPSAPTGEQLI